MQKCCRPEHLSVMDGTYFVRRKKILDRINILYAVSLFKLDQTCTDAAAGQILDAMEPGKVYMIKVDWSANKDYEYIQNYKVLIQAFVQLKIDKHVEVDHLVRGKYHDNLEFMQWFKAFSSTMLQVNFAIHWLSVGREGRISVHEKVLRGCSFVFVDVGESIAS